MRAARLAGLALLVLACRTTGVPQVVAVIGEDDRVRAWVGHAREAGADRSGVRAIGRLEVRGPRGSTKVRQVIIAERPDRLRLESLNFLGQTASLLVMDGEQYAFYDGKKVERGGVFPDLLRETMGLDLAPHEAVALLVASPELPSGAPQAILGQGLDRIAEYRFERLRFAGDGQLRAVESFDSAGRLRWHAEYDRWSDVPGGRYPFEMAFSFPASGVRAEIELDEVEVNPSLDPALFSLLPEGSE